MTQNSSHRDNLEIMEIHKEMDLIQGCITRMSNNSFWIKGGFISLLTIVLTMDNFNLTKENGFFIIVAIFYLWYLDSFFLSVEKKYRKIYQWVIVEREKGNRDLLYDLNPKRFETTVPFCTVFLSKTLLIFYGIPISVIVFKFLI